MRISKFIAATVVASTVVCGSCEPFFEPCPQLSASALVAGTWVLTTVNGAAIPSSGVPIPNSSDRLSAGTLEFANIANGCLNQALQEERGYVVGTYTLLTSSGSPKPDANYTADYTHDGPANSVLVEADTKQAGASVTLGTNATMIFAGTLPQFGSLTLGFRRSN